MSQTFFFYDTETSGISSRMQRIMQFAGQRTDMDLNPIGDPLNILVKLDPDVLPDPYSVLVHGITPQKAVSDGIEEPELIQILNKEVFTPNTIIAGFNNVRFDDEFIRNLMYRNFYDPYTWHWQDNRSRWDLLDAMRMARGLRPDGIEWAKDKTGKATNRLESLAKANNISHDDAHDALADVNATIDLARILKKAQPQLFDWLVKVRDKKEVASLVSLENPKPFVYTSGRYSSEHDKTTVAFPISPVKDNPSAVLVYDLRIDPKEYIDLGLDELKVRAFSRKEELGDLARLPVKKLSLNRCPAVAPMTVLDAETKERLGLNLDEIEKNIKTLDSNKDFSERIRTLWDEKKYDPNKDVDLQLYEGFFNDHDAQAIEKVRQSKDLSDLATDFDDPRLDTLLIRYKARHYPETLNDKEQIIWNEYRNEKLENGLPGQMSIDKFFTSIYALRETGDKKLLNALTDYGQSMAPKRPTLI